MRRRLAPILLFCSLLSAACGARLNEEQRVAVGASPGGDTTTDQQVAVGSPAATPTTVVADTTGTATDNSAPDSGSTNTNGTTPPADGGGAASTAPPSTAGGGDQPVAADPSAGGGAATPAATAASGPDCSGGGASDVGVSDTEIKVGNVSIISGPVPGFGQTSVNAVKAYFNFINAQGGVCGRDLTLVAADDRFSSGTNKAEHDKLKGEVFAFVGALSVVDDGGAVSLEGSGIPDVGLSVSEARIRLAENYSPTPINLQDGGNGTIKAFGYLKRTFGVSKVGVIWPAQATAKARIEGYVKDAERAGLDVVYRKEVSVTETNYSDEAAGVEDAGVEVLITTLELSGMANMAKALDQNGYFPEVPFYGAQAYGRQFLDQAGSAAEPTVLMLQYSIFEDAPNVPEMANFLQWYQQSNPGADVDFFALEAWVSAKMFVDALKLVDGPPTRAKVIDALKTFTSYEAGGLKAPINPAQKKSASCYMHAEVVDGAWKRIHPATGFDCT